MMPAPAKRPSLPRDYTGFTLLEVMISLVILSIGVLGIIALQVSTYKSLQTSHNYAYAAMLANDMADRVLANPGFVEDYDHDAGEMPDSLPDCNTVDDTCTGQERAIRDISEWQSLVQGVLLGTTTPVPGALPAGAGLVEFFAAPTGGVNIVVRWDDDLSGSTGTNCSDLTGVTNAPTDLDCYVLTLWAN